MGRKWVNDSFKKILLDNCQAYLVSKDLGKNKARTQLIDDVANEIREAAAGLELPHNLNKVCCDFGGSTSSVLLIIIWCSPSESGLQTRLKKLSGTRNQQHSLWGKPA